MLPPSATHRLGSALETATRRYGEALRDAETSAVSGSEARSLVARLGLPTQLLAKPGSNCPPLLEPERAAALSRLRTESRRLARLARARHPTYDLNRHIAVRRLLSALDPADVPACRKPRRRSPQAGRLTPQREAL